MSAVHLISVLYAPQAALGNPEAYIGNFPYEFAAGTYNIDPAFDPAVSNPTGKSLQDDAEYRRTKPRDCLLQMCYEILHIYTHT